MYQRENDGMSPHLQQDANHLGQALRVNSILTVGVASVKC